MKKENKNTKKIDKKVLILIGIFVVLIVFGILLYKSLTKKVTLAIDIKTENVAFTYGPNGVTKSNLKIGDEVKLVINTDSKSSVKCVSSNSEIVEVTNDKAIAKSNGAVQVYCTTKNVKSNIIDLKVGE